MEIGRKILAVAATNAKCMQLLQLRFSTAILDLQLNGTVYKIADTTIEKLDPENMGVAARISFLSALELEIIIFQCITDWGTFVPQPYSVEKKKVRNARVNLLSRGR